MTTDSHRSQDWYRVAEARPRLRRDASATRHVYLGRPWYVLTDRTGTKVHRLTPAAWAIAGRFDGTQDVKRIWQDVSETLAEDAPTQDEVVQLMTQLHQADLLESAETPHLADLLTRRDKARGMAWRKLLLNPLSATLPLVDPDRFLKALARAMSPLPSALWWLIALAVILAGLTQLPLHWAALRARGLDGFLDLENLGLIALIYPVVKALHEIGHGVVTRSRGGEVHEMGLMFIAFYPIPYVEASAALRFPSKWDRAAVAAAGVVVELVIASLAFLLWIHTEPGALRAVLFNTMVISGLSTLAVNGNPLLKFDGYHVLCDLIEIPNLAQRGNQWWGEKLRIHLLGTIERPRARMQTVRWERLWFALYPPAALVYRVMISLTIALFVAGTYRLLGIVLAAWSLTLSLLWPALKTARKAWTDPRIRAAGGRATGGALAAGGLLALGLFAVPLPHMAVVQGVTWLPDDAFVRAPEDGRVASLAQPPGAMVDAAAPLLTLSAPDLSARVRMAEAQLARARAELAAARVTDRAQAADRSEAVEQAAATLAQAQDRLAALSVTAELAGQLDIPGQTSPEGRFFRRGEVIAHVLPDTPPVIRVAVPQDLAELVRGEVRRVEVRFASDISRALPGHVARSVPAGSDALPSPVLALDGGGPFATTPTQDGSLRSATRLFQFDVALDAPSRPAWGMRAHVRLTFAPKPLATRISRAVRAVFLDAFDV
ncbi:peptidase M50 [Mesobacterium pallidum]|uniref:peptidase M50 n=1 Tax=Mesobacterium pallidum TaxID=2872037 RepID=UPI001EE2519A|nr:peptidase M50 [Mesobacterium pallidum]